MNSEKIKAIFTDEKKPVSEKVKSSKLKRNLLDDLITIKNAAKNQRGDQVGSIWLKENVDYFFDCMGKVNFCRFSFRSVILSRIRTLLSNSEFDGKKEDLVFFLEYLSNKLCLSENELNGIPFLFFCQLTSLIRHSTMGNRKDLPRLFTIFHNIYNMDFYPLLSGLSPLEKKLRFDPSGIYPNMTKESQGLYKARIIKDAKQKGILPEVNCQELLRKAKTENIHLGFLLKKRKIGFLSFVPVFILFFFLMLKFHFAVASFVLTFFTAVPLYLFVRDFVDFVYSHLAKSEILPAMKLDKVDDSNKTCVVITSLITNKNEVDNLCEKMQQYAINNRKKGDEIYFGLLCDYKESTLAREKNDSEIGNYLSEKISDLNKHDCIYFSVIRERIFHSSENKFVGWERKRGAIEELVSYLAGEEWPNAQLFGVKEKIIGSKYLITLDADTRLGIGQAKRLIGIAEHPLNRPVIAEKDRKKFVSSGYGILQPKISSSLLEKVKTPFGKIFTNGSGTPAYAAASYDWMQSFFDEGNFCGKGLICIDAYYTILKNRFPAQKILSHDMPEGALLRCGLVTNEYFSDSSPQTYLSHYKRLHRWIRGDVQNIPFLFSLTRFRTWFALENLSRYFVPLSELFLLVLSGIMGKVHGTVCALLVLFFHCKTLLITLVNLIINGNTEHFSRHFSSKIRNLVLNGIYQFILSVGSIVFEAYYFTDAIIRSLYRMIISKKKMLEWQVYSPISKTKSEFFFFLPAVLLSILVFLIPSNILTKLIYLLNIFFFALAAYLSKPYLEICGYNQKEKDKLISYAKEEFKFFQECVNEKTSYLPPDNIQLEPMEKIAMRTSPTNIGLYLASLIAGYDLELIGYKEMIKRIRSAVETTRKLKRYHGHLFNWYDLATLEVIGDEFISTVDSGNYVACLIVVVSALETFSEKDPTIRNLIETLRNEIYNTNFLALFDVEKSLFRVGIHPSNEKATVSNYDLYMSEARITSFLSIALGQIPHHHWASLSRQLLSFQGRAGVGSWTGTAFEYFMPALFIPVIENSLEDESLSYALFCQKKYHAIATHHDNVFGISESGYSATDSQGNYQYFAFGVPYLSMKQIESPQKVISPYASFLMLERKAPELLKNLEVLSGLGMLGPFGFYESCEFNSNFLGDYSVVASYMAHHKGMTMLSLANALCNNIFQERFMKFDHFSAKIELMAERFPIEGKVQKRKHQKMLSNHFPSPIEDRVCTVNGAERNCNFITDGKMAIFTFDEGNNRILWNGIDLFDFQKGGIIPSLKLNNEIVSIRENSVWEKKVHFGLNFTEYIFKFKKISIVIRFELIGGSNMLLLRSEIQGFKGECSLTFDFSAILQKEIEYRSHPAFQALSLEATLKDGSFTISRRSLEKPYFLHFLSNNKFNVFLENPTNEKRYEQRMMLTPNVKLEFLLQASGNVKNAIIIAPSIRETPPKFDFLDGAFNPAKEILERSYDKICHINETCFFEEKTKVLERKVILQLFSTRKFYFVNSFQTSNKELLWKYGISGDFPMIVIRISNEDNKELDTVEQLIRIAKKMHLSGLQVDLIIIHKSSGEYFDPMRNCLTEKIMQNQCEFLLGKHSGIHFIVPTSEDDINSFLLAADISFNVKGKKTNEVEEKDLIPITKTFSSKTSSNEVGTLRKGEVLIEKEKFNPNVPFSHVVSNRLCGFICNQNSLGFTWYRNAGLGRITKWDNLPKETDGEKVYFEKNGRVFDLLQNADLVSYRRHIAVYSGKLDGESYQIFVTATECLAGKTVYISLSEELSSNGKLIYSFVPALGPTPTENVLVTKGEQNEILFAPAILGEYKTKGYFAVKQQNCDVFKSGERLCISFIAKKENLCFIGGFYSERHLKFIVEKINLCQLEEILGKENEFSARQFRNKLSDKAFWIQYQAIHSRFFGRSGLYQSSGAFGFRDQLQDCLCFLSISPEVTKQHICRAASHQFEEGDVQHWWHTIQQKDACNPGIRSRCSDDYLWLLYVTSEYIRSTGDREILNINLPFLVGKELAYNESDIYFSPKKGESSPLSVHLERAADLFLKRGLGKNSLPFIGNGDWNDGMNMVTGESIWLGFFGSISLNRCLPFFNDSLRKKVKKFLSEVHYGLEKAFNGCWFIRAIRENNDILGSDISLETECSIDLITQAFAAFYELEFYGSEYSLTENSVRKSLISAYEILFDSKSRTTKLFTKPFKNTKPAPGYIQRYCAGARENGGQYTHAAVWFALALIQYGKKTNDKTLIQYGKSIAEHLDPFVNFDLSNFQRYQREPYVLCGDIYTAEGLEGHGGWSWYTGAASWYLKLLKEIEKIT